VQDGTNNSHSKTLPANKPTKNELSDPPSVSSMLKKYIVQYSEHFNTKTGKNSLPVYL
jgi:hypothetical protein